jgi:hypothetical protein
VIKGVILLDNIVARKQSFLRVISDIRDVVWDVTFQTDVVEVRNLTLSDDNGIFLTGVLVYLGNIADRR